MASTPDSTPVVLVHGWGGSFETTWRRSGFTELLADAGRPVIGVDLLGHGEAPKPHDSAAYADLTDRVVGALPDEPVDAVGFSLGAFTLLFAQYAGAPGNDRQALLALLRRPAPRPFEAAEVAAVSVPVLVVIGDRDHAGPADQLVAALPDARCVVLRRTDHFATPESFGFIDAVLGFLDAVPS